MTALPALRRRLLPGLGIVAVLALALAACTPEPPPTNPPSPPPVTRPECGSAEATSADGTAITVRTSAGQRRVVEVDRGDDVDAAVDRQRSKGSKVLDVAPEVPVATAIADADVDDPYFAPGGGGGQFGLWGAKRIDAPDAWGSAGNLRQGQGVTVAVVDTGVQGDHPGLAGRVLPGADFVVGAPYDGRVDGNGHGTHVAGTIAETDDAAGGVGIAPQARILPVRVLGCSGGGTSSDVANGVYWAVDHGADVINLSLGTGSPSSTILASMDYALAHGVVVAAAGGNGGSSSCPPASPVTTTSSSSTTSTTNPSASTTTSPPVSAPAAAVTTTTTTEPAAGSAETTGSSAPAPSTTTSTTAPSTTAPATVPTTAPTVDAAEAAPPVDAAVTIEAVVVPGCSPGAFSSSLYPAAYATGRPGLIAVAATGLYTDLTPAAPLTSGTIDWKVSEGSDVVPGTLIANVGAQQVKAQTHGVLVQRKVADGATVSGSPALATVISADHRAPYSNVSQYLTLAAPGGALPSTPYGIHSTLPGSAYGFKSGTSMAAPHVAGVAALVRARCPGLTPAQVVAALTGTAEDLGQAGWDPAYGAGMVRAADAVAAAC